MSTDQPKKVGSTSSSSSGASTPVPTTPAVSKTLKRPSTTIASADGNASASELGAMVDELLNNLSAKFSTVSSELFTKMDEMARRLDALEESVQSNQAASRSNTPTKS